MVTLVAGLLWHNERLRVEAEKTARERDAAQKSQRAARRAVNDMYTQVGEEWLADAPHMTEMQREFLTKALEFYEEVVREPGAEPEDRLELTRALQRIAIIRDVFSRPRAERELREAVRVLEGLVAESSGVPEYRLELARACNRLGRFLVDSDQLPEAAAVLARARELVGALCQSQPDGPEYRQEMALALYQLSTFLQRTGRLAEAREASLQARDQARSLVDRWPTTRYRELLVQTTRGLGRVSLEMNDWCEAKRCFLEARGLLEPLLHKFPHRPALQGWLASVWENLGALHLQAGEVEKAEEAVSRSLALRRKFREDFPSSDRIWHSLASGYALHGGILSRLGQFRKAEDAFSAALPLQEQVVKATGIDRRREELAVLIGGLAWIRLRQPRAAAAVGEVVPLLRRAREMAPAGERYRLTLLGLAYYRLGKWEEGVATLRLADEVPAAPCRWTTDDPLIRWTAEEQEDIAPTVNAFCLAMAYHRSGRVAEATDYYRRGLNRGQDQHVPPRFRFVDVETIRAEVEAVLGRGDPAQPPREKR
jgi:tetratricopeptide (TPR) repeat protein